MPTLLTTINEWHFPYETVEWVGPLSVLVNGVASNNFKVCMLADGTRPLLADWEDPVADGASYGVMYDALGVGTWRIWIKYTTVLETIILDDVGLIVAH